MKCPGQDSRYWKPGAIFEVSCPKCGEDVEFFKDDTSRKCNHCGHRFVNPHMDFGCAAYCQYAEQCLGTLPPEVAAQQENLLKDKVAVEMKRYFKKDFKRIGHAMRVARHAERIGKIEGGNLALIYLHDIGIPLAEKKYGSSAPEYQEQEGPEVARSILIDLGAPESLIGPVCDIVGHHHHPRGDDSREFKVVYDADWIVNREERIRNNPPDTESDLKKKPVTVQGMDIDCLTESIEASLLTEGGRKIAKEVLIPEVQL
jgi:hypothetical protein